MQIIKFNIVIHGNDAAELLNSHEMDLRFVNDLPENGLIAFEHGEVIAMGFLRCMEGSYAIYDSFITNNFAKSDQRDKALTTIIDKLSDWAKDNNIHKLIAFTTDRGLNRRLITKHDFDLDYDMRFFSKTLNYLE